MDKKILNVIHDENLETYLDSLGVLSDVKNGHKRCKFCKNIVTLENLHSIFPQSGNINFVCDSPECIKMLAELLNTTEIK